MDTLKFGFNNAETLRLKALDASFAVTDIEEELKALTQRLFVEMLADRVFDANSLGAPHLGSFELVRRFVNLDGLVLLDGEAEQPATRYLYRAWKAENNQGRGLHFLRMYLQLLFPVTGKVTQLWQPKDKVYPSGLLESDDGNCFLTSRIRVTINGTPDAKNDVKIMSSISSIIPARLVPEFRYETLSALNLYAVSTADCMEDYEVDAQIVSVVYEDVNSTLFTCSAVHTASFISMDAVLREIFYE